MHRSSYFLATAIDVALGVEVFCYDGAGATQGLQSAASLRKSLARSGQATGTGRAWVIGLLSESPRVDVCCDARNSRALAREDIGSSVAFWGQCVRGLISAELYTCEFPM